MKMSAENNVNHSIFVRIIIRYNRLKSDQLKFSDLDFMTIMYI